MAEFRLSPAAERDLENIWLHTRQKWNVDQADRYIGILAAAFQALAEAPLSAPSCDHIRAGYRRRVIERHAVYFRVTAHGISIIRVLHDRMDAPRHL